MANHQDPLAFFRQGNELVTLRNSRAKRFLQEDVLAGVQGLFGQFEVGRNRGDDGDGVRRGILDGLLAGSRGANPRKAGGHLRQPLRIEISDFANSNPGKTVDIPDKIGAPMTCADNVDLNAHNNNDLIFI